MNKCDWEGCNSLNTKPRTRAATAEEFEIGFARSGGYSYPVFRVAWFCEGHFDLAAQYFPQVSDPNYGAFEV